jgi:hypothetical protein
VQLTRPDERFRHVMPIPMIITRRTSGSRYFHSYICLGVGNMLGGYASHWHLFARRWKHARRLRLTLAFIHPALETRSGAATRFGIPLPRRWQHARGLRLELAFLRLGVGNTLRGCASNWHSFALALATRSGAAPYNPMLATLRGYAYMLILASTIFLPGVSNTLGDSALCC